MKYLKIFESFKSIDVSPEDLIKLFRQEVGSKKCNFYDKRDNCGPAALDFISWGKSKGIKDLKRINGYFKADIPVFSKKDFTHEMKQEFLSTGRNWDSDKERLEWISNSQYAEQCKYIPHYWVEDSNNKIYDPVGQQQFIDTGYAKDLNQNRYTLTDEYNYYDIYETGDYGTYTLTTVRAVNKEHAKLKCANKYVGKKSKTGALEIFTTGFYTARKVDIKKKISDIESHILALQRKLEELKRIN